MTRWSDLTPDEADAAWRRVLSDGPKSTGDVLASQGPQYDRLDMLAMTKAMVRIVARGELVGERGAFRLVGSGPDKPSETSASGPPLTDSEVAELTKHIPLAAELSAKTAEMERYVDQHPEEASYRLWDDPRWGTERDWTKRREALEDLGYAAAEYVPRLVEELMQLRGKVKR